MEDQTVMEERCGSESGDEDRPEGWVQPWTQIERRRMLRRMNALIALGHEATTTALMAVRGYVRVPPKPRLWTAQYEVRPE